MRLLNNFCLIEIISTKDSASDLIIGVEEDNGQTIGIVKAIGPGKVTKKGKLIPVELKVGDKVVFETYMNHKDFITINGKKHAVIPEDLVLAKIGDMPSVTGISFYEQHLDGKLVRKE